MQETTRPRQRRWWIAALAVLVLGGAAFLGLRWYRRAHALPDGFIVSLRPLDDGGAIAIWRRNGDDDTRGFASKIDDQGELVWWRELPDVPRSVGPHHNVFLGDGAVAITYSHMDGAQAVDNALIALDTKDGKVRWDTQVAPFHPDEQAEYRQWEPMLGLYFSGGFAGGRFLISTDDGHRHHGLAGVDAASGAVVWRTEKPDRPLSTPLPLGDRIFFAGIIRTQVLDAAAGTITSLAQRGAGCAVDGSYVAIRGHGAARALFETSPDDPSAGRAIADSWVPVGNANDYLHVQGCGRYGDHLIFSVTAEAGDDERSFVVITDASGAVLHAIPTTHDMYWDGVDNIPKVEPAVASLRGTLPRFVPYVLLPLHDDARLVMFDLERGAIAWRGPPSKELIHFNLFHVGDLWYLTRGEFRPSITVFDGKTGALVASASLDSYYGVDAVRPDQVRNGAVWVASGQWRPLDDAPIAVLDARSLVPRVTRYVDVEDATQAMRQTLGVPAR